MWREDTTNQNTLYLRNHLRIKAIPKMNRAHRREFVKIIDKVAEITDDKNKYLATLSQYIEENNKIKRSIYSELQNQVAEEYLHKKLRFLGEIDRKTIARVSIAIKTSRAGSKTNIIRDKFLVADRDYAWVE